MIRLGAGLWQGGDSTHWVPRAAPATRCVLGAVPMFGALPQRWHSPSAAGFGQVGSGVSVLAQGAAPGLVPRRLCPEDPGLCSPSLLSCLGSGMWAQGLGFLAALMVPPYPRCCLHPWGSSGVVFVL